MKISTFIFRVLKFGICGSIGMLIDFSFTILFKEYFQLNPYLSNLLGVSIAMVIVFNLNKRWTFADSNSNVRKQFQQFFIVSSFGFIWNSALVYLFHQNLGFSFYLGKFFAIVLVAIWNFSLNSIFTFKVTK